MTQLDLGSKLISLSLLVLALVAGAWGWRTFVAKPRIVTKIEWYDRTPFIKPTVQSQTGTSTIIHTRDTVFQTAPCDSLRTWARDRLQPFRTIFTGDISTTDSLGSFFTTVVDTIDADPWTKIIVKATSYQNTLLRLSRVNTTITVTEIDWFVSLGTFVLGVLIALLIS